jgi:hypothetical protein
MSIGKGAPRARPGPLVLGRMIERHASASSTNARNNTARDGTPRLSGTRRSASSRASCSGVTRRSNRIKCGLKISCSSFRRARRARWSSSRSGFGRRRLFFLDSSDSSDMRDFVHAPRSLSRPNRATGLQSNGRLKKTRPDATVSRDRSLVHKALWSRSRGSQRLGIWDGSNIYLYFRVACEGALKFFQSCGLGEIRFLRVDRSRRLSDSSSWGDHYGNFTDRFGVQWAVNSSPK